MFLYVATWASIDQFQSQIFIESLNLFAEMSNDVTILKDSFSIMISKFPMDEDEEYMHEKLSSILDSPIISEKAKYLLKIGIQKVNIFEKPKKGDKIQNTQLLETLVSRMEFVDMAKHSTNFQFKLDEDMTPLANELIENGS